MWLETPEYREMNGNAIGNLTLKPNVIAEDSDAYVHEFVAVDKDVTSYGFSIGAYLIVSSSKRYAVASGRCVAVEASAIKLQLERFVRHSMSALSALKSPSMHHFVAQQESMRTI